MQQILSIFKPQAEAKMVQIDWNMDQSFEVSDSLDRSIPAFQCFENRSMSKKLPSLVGDSRRFKQVLVNLIKNALKFTN